VDQERREFAENDSVDDVIAVLAVELKLRHPAVPDRTGSRLHFHPEHPLLVANPLDVELRGPYAALLLVRLDYNRIDLSEREPRH
jgi:hypothetical protein